MRCVTRNQTLRPLWLAWPHPSFFWYDTDFLEIESFDFIDHILYKSVSYQKKDGRGQACRSFFWYDNDKDLEVCFLVYQEITHSTRGASHPGSQQYFLWKNWKNDVCWDPVWKQWGKTSLHLPGKWKTGVSDRGLHEDMYHASSWYDSVKHTLAIVLFTWEAIKGAIINYHQGGGY